MSACWESYFSSRPFRYACERSLLATIATVLLLTGCDAPANGVASIRVYCAASLRPPMEKLANEYKHRTKIQIQLQFGGSNTLLNQLEISKTGDLFLSADSFYIDLAKQRGLSSESVKLAQMSPVIVVSPHVTSPLTGLDDLLEGDYRIALADPDSAAIGRTTKSALQSHGKWESLEETVRRKGVFTPTVSGVANAVALGSVDAGIVWNSVAKNYPELTVLIEPDLASYGATAEIAILESCTDLSTAADFVEFVCDQGSGWPVFQEYGFVALTEQGQQ